MNDLHKEQTDIKALLASKGCAFNQVLVSAWSIVIRLPGENTDLGYFTAMLSEAGLWDFDHDAATDQPSLKYDEEKDETTIRLLRDAS